MTYSLQCQIGIDCTCAIAKQRRKMMDFPRFPRLQHDCQGCALLRLNQMLMNRRDCQQRRNRHMVFVHAPVCKNQDIRPVSVRPVHFHKQMVNSFFQVCIFIVSNRYFFNLKPFYFHIFNFQHIRVRQNRMLDFQYLAVNGLLI